MYAWSRFRVFCMEKDLFWSASTSVTIDLTRDPLPAIARSLAYILSDVFAGGYLQISRKVDTKEIVSISFMSVLYLGYYTFLPEFGLILRDWFASETGLENRKLVGTADSSRREC